MDKAAKLIRPYLRKFIFLTHPDYFQLEPTKKHINAISIQKLTEIFSGSTKATTTTTTTAHSTNPTDQRSVKLEFFLKKQQYQKKKDEKPIVGIFGTKDSDWSKTQTFFQLCQEAGIPILDADMETVQSMLQRLAEERQTTGHEDKRMSLAEEFAKELYKQHCHRPPTKNSHEQQQQQQQWQPKDILNNELIMFGPNVNKKAMVKELCQRLPELMPERWWGKKGVLVVSPTSEVKPTKGVIVIRTDMTLDEMKACIENQFTDT